MFHAGQSSSRHSGSDIMVPKSAVTSAAVRDFSPTSATDGYRLGLLSGINTPQTIANRGSRRHHHQSAITAPANSNILIDAPIAPSNDVERRTIHRNERLQSVVGQFMQQHERNENTAVSYGDSLGVMDDDGLHATAPFGCQNIYRQQHRVSARSPFNGRLTRSSACFNIAEACDTFCQPSDAADNPTFTENFAADSDAISACRTGSLITCPRGSSVSSQLAIYPNNEPTAVGTCRRRWKDLPTDNHEFSQVLSSMAPVRSNDDTPPHQSPRPIQARSSAVATTKIRQKRLALQKPTSPSRCERFDCSNPLSPMSSSSCISNGSRRTDTTAKPVKFHMLRTAQQPGADEYMTSSARDDENEKMSSMAATGARPKSVSRPKHNTGNRLPTNAHVRPFKPCEVPVSCDATYASDHTNAKHSRRCAIPRPLRSKTPPLTTVTCDPVACWQLKSDKDSFSELAQGCGRPAPIAGGNRPRTAGPQQQNRNYDDRDLTFAVDDINGGGLERSTERRHQGGLCSGTRIAKRFPGTSDHFLQRSEGLDRVHKNDTEEIASEVSRPNSTAFNVDKDFQKLANDLTAVSDNRKVAKLVRRPSTSMHDRLISDRSHQSIPPMPEAPFAHQPRISPFGCGQVGSNSNDDEYCPTWSTAAVSSELETDGSGDWHNSSAQGGLPSDKAASCSQHGPHGCIPSHHGRSSIRQSSKSASVVPTPRSIGSFLVNYVYPSFRAFLIWSFSGSAKLAAWFKASVLDLVRVVLEQLGQVINDPERELLWHHLELLLDDWHLFIICMVLLTFFMGAVGVICFFLTN